MLIAGLGNPGARYAATRHNAGYWLVDKLAQQAGVSLRSETKFHGEVAKVTYANSHYWLLKPNTFMNLSGQAVAALARFYKITPDQIVVVHDELDFPPGTIRLKQGGGDGKHNGLKSIIAQLGSPQFLRLRIGIGHPGKARDVANYVLDAPLASEFTAIDTALNLALDTFPWLMSGQLDKVMLQLHTK
jgi:PTH1 family peptidyl-tRNA hydrolase